MLFIVKFEQVIGVLEENFSQQGGKLYFRHGIREAFSQMRTSDLYKQKVAIYTNYSKTLFMKCIWPELKPMLTK
jgi:hypothetical protein